MPSLRSGREISSQPSQNDPSPNLPLDDSPSPTPPDIEGMVDHILSNLRTRTSDELPMPPNFPPPPNNHNYAEGVTGNTLLIDIPFDHLGTFVGTANSMLFIPDHSIVGVRRVFIKYSTEALNPGQGQVIIDLAWKKYCLLPIILFDTCKSTREMKKILRERIRKLDANIWDFSLSELKLRVPAVSSSKTDDQIYERSSRLASVGEIGRSYRNYMGDKRRLIPDMHVFESLSEKYVDVGDHGLSDSQMNEMKNYRRNIELQKESITDERLGRIIHKGKRRTQHGFDKFRYEHLQKLWGYSSSIDAQTRQFRSLYNKIITRIMNAEIPLAVQPFFRDSEAFAVPKGEADIRPLGNTNLDRKIAAAANLSNNRSDAISFFENSQYCCENLGTEKCIHAFRAMHDVHPENDTYLMDAKGAFNYSSRWHGLYQCFKSFPTLFPFLMLLYGVVSKTWFFGLAEGIKSIDCQEGSQQGCTMGMFLCALAFHPFIQKLKDMVGAEGITRFFADDGNISTSFERMVRCIQLIKETGPTYGYILHLQKGSYLMGKCGSYPLAFSRRNTLIELGINPTIIHMHPYDSALDPQLSITAEEARLSYGSKVLGSYIGTDEFIRAQLDLHLLKLSEEAEKLVLYDDLQTRYLFFRYCFCQKINHLLRTIPPRLTQSFVVGFNNLKKKILCSILDKFNKDTLPDWLWTQSCFSVSAGGLGLQDSTSTAHAAYVASVIDCLDSTEAACPDVLTHNVDYIESLNFSILHISEACHCETALSIAQLRSLKSERDSSMLQHELSTRLETVFRASYIASLTDNKHLGWYTSVSDDFASLWLNVTPKSKDFTFAPSVFRAQLCHRMYLPQPELPVGLQCDCIINKQHPVIDDRCHHIVTGCNKNGNGINLHHTVCNVIVECAGCLGINARREEACFNRAPGVLSRKKTDITLKHMPGPGPSEHAIDVSSIYTVPIFGVRDNRAYTRSKALVPERQGHLRWEEKLRTYLDLANLNDLKFIPIIFETTGRMYSSSLTYIKSLLRANNILDGQALSNYWLCRISCCYQQALSSSILEKLRKQKGAGIAAGRYENRVEFITSFQHLRT